MSGPSWAQVELVAPPVELQACRLCGMRRGRREPDDDWTVDVRPTVQQSQVRRSRRDDGRERFEADEPPWSRRHTSCEPTAAAVVSAVVGAVVDDEPARAALAAVEFDVLAGDRDVTARKPWAFLTAAEIGRLRAAVIEAEAPAAAAPCRDGRCGSCGRSSSTAWTRPGLFWAVDGLPAAVCADCELLVPEAFSVDVLRLRALAVLADVEPTVALRAHRTFGMQLAADVLTADERYQRDAEPWTYRPEALREVRRIVRELRPHLIRGELQRQIGMRVLNARRARAAREADELHTQETPGAAAAW